MELDLTLDSLKFANVSDFSRDFGEKVQTNAGSLTTKQFNQDIAKVFDIQRPVVITEDSSTGDIEHDANIVINATESITLVIGDGSYIGCKLTITNLTDDSHLLTFDEDADPDDESNITLSANKNITLFWNGTKWKCNNVIDDSATDEFHCLSAKAVNGALTKCAPIKNVTIASGEDVTVNLTNNPSLFLVTGSGVTGTALFMVSPWGYVNNIVPLTGLTVTHTIYTYTAVVSWQGAGEIYLSQLN